MDSGNGPNQHNRYCPTPIMAPPTVAASPPIMSGGNVMNTPHQPTHHPPPSISPHPGGYYGHHTSATTGHYPTPSPTPPPASMHHQQYYSHYYAHGSHQQAQQQQQSQQSQHHAIANAHVPINTPPGSAQPTSQHSHMMGHGSYHHPQSQPHHQQWAPISHQHQQQSHHYYHQPTHHSPQQQQPQQQTQQHGYPPPPHSPYSYVQPHAPAPTPPPHTTHAQQQHLQQTTQPQQQHQHSPQVSVSPSPGQMHQTSPQQQQQPQQHALMSLSRFVSQQSPPSPSPRASPSLTAGHHSQNMSQMGPTSPSHYAGHMEHHSSMNGHTANQGANNSPVPVMSPPPVAPVPTQQPMSPASPVSHSTMIMPPQIPHNANGGEVLDKNIPGNSNFVSSSHGERENSGLTMKTDASSNSNNKIRDLPTVFANITPSKIASFMNHDLKKPTPTNDTTSSNSDSIFSKNSAPNVADVGNSVGESGFLGISSAYSVTMEEHMPPEIPKDFDDLSTPPTSEEKRASSSPTKLIGSPSNAEKRGSNSPSKQVISPTNVEKRTGHGHTPPKQVGSPSSTEKRASSSPSKQMGSPSTPDTKTSYSPSKQMGSPTSSEKGHQLMPVRLQNMHKGARTKATMKKLMQEQHITTPNGQLTDNNSDSYAKDAEMMGSEHQKPAKSTEKPVKSRKKKAQSKEQISTVVTNDSAVPMSPINLDLMVSGDSSTLDPPVIRKGYTKSGKKIGRPRKDAVQTQPLQPVKTKKKRESKITPKKSKSKQDNDIESTAALELLNAGQPVFEMLPTETEVVAAPVLPEATLNVKRKTSKASRKRPQKLSNVRNVTESLKNDALSDLNTPPQAEEDISHSVETPVNESVLPVKTTGKKRSKKSANINNSSDSSPDSAVLNSIIGSKISQQEAESVALRVIQPSTPILGKRKRKSKNLTPNTTETGTPVTPVRRSKSGSGGGKNAKTTNAVLTKEVIISPERGELPRLRSRSPKQRESPPLRISSPRAAKERSSTPATSTSQSSTSRSRASREKDTQNVSTVTTPLSSPSLRSPKKSPEKKQKEKAAIRSSSRQKANEALNQELSEAHKEVLASPPSKRSRQMSKESLDSGGVQKNELGRRKSRAIEKRLSSDSERSHTSKRVSRRKSGSATGSTENFSSPSFNHTDSSLSLIPSDGVSELALDISVSSNADNPSIIDEQNFLPDIPSTSISKRRKPKKIGKSKAKSRKLSLESSAIIQTTAELQSDTADKEPEPVMLPISIEMTELNPKTLSPIKKARKSPVKKNKRSSSFVTAEATVSEEVNVNDGKDEIDPNAELNVLGKISGVQSKNRKGTGRSKHKKVLPNSTEALNDPVVPPVTLSIGRKNVKFSPLSKLKVQKKSKKTSVKAEEETITLAEGNTHIDSTNSLAVLGESSETSQSPDISPYKRRRSSLASATNTQVSAKSNTQIETQPLQKVKTSVYASGTPNTLRRDSRSLSRDYDVSVVLTDIAQAFTAGDTSLVGISTSLSRLQSPTTTFTPAQPSQPPPLTDQSIPDSKEINELSATVDDSVSTSSNKGKRKAKKKSDVDQPLKKKSKLALQNQALQERKAILEAEVALVLLDLKSSTSSKSPSPAKSIPSGGDPHDVVLTKKKGKGKTRKRKNSKSPRRSIENSGGILDSTIETINVDSVVATSDSATISAVLNTEKGMKRKGVKARRSTDSKKLITPSMVSSSIDGEFNSRNDGASIWPHSLSSDLNAVMPSSSLKEPKTEPGPPTAELTAFESPVKGKLKKGNKSTPTKVPKISATSPDITAIPKTSPDMVKRKQNRKSKKQLDANVMLQSSGNCMPLQVSASQAENLLVTSALEVPSKKKRQRKDKVSVELASTNVDVPSTSALALLPKTFPQETPSTSTSLALQLPSSSKLFPYQISPTPYKKPTVFCKSIPTTEAARDNDNQKKKTHDAPAVKLVGWRTKFYRGGEVEEVDADPKLPKEKALLPTDNAVPWICSFCHLGPHAQKLGDLFGPYFANLPSIYGQPSSKRETWMHGDCALWAGRLLLIGTYLKRLEETLRDADKEVCTICGRNGATIGCLQRGCREAVHYPCAVRRFWKMDEHNFHSYCPKHIP